MRVDNASKSEGSQAEKSYAAECVECGTPHDLRLNKAGELMCHHCLGDGKCRCADCRTTPVRFRD